MSQDPFVIVRRERIGSRWRPRRAPRSAPRRAPARLARAGPPPAHACRARRRSPPRTAGRPARRTTASRYSVNGARADATSGSPAASASSAASPKPSCSDGIASTSASLEQRRDIGFGDHAQLDDRAPASRVGSRSARAIELARDRRRDPARSRRPGSRAAPAGQRARSRAKRPAVRSVFLRSSTPPTASTTGAPAHPGARATRARARRQHGGEAPRVDAVAHHHAVDAEGAPARRGAPASLTVKQRSASRTERSWQRARSGSGERLDVVDGARQRQPPSALARRQQSRGAQAVLGVMNVVRVAVRDQVGPPARRRAGAPAPRSTAGRRRPPAPAAARARSGRKKPRPSLSSA